VIVFKKPPQEEIHIEDVKQVNGQWLVAGTSGVILIVIGMGPTMRQAQSQVYSRIKNVLIPNMYYRTDIGDVGWRTPIACIPGDICASNLESSRLNFSSHLVQMYSESPDTKNHAGLP
jgi:hypothetical protein